MKKLLLSIYCLMLVVLTACEKEIDMDYRQVSPKYVAEAVMTQDNTTVFLSTTQDVTDNSRKEHAITNATISIFQNSRKMAELKHTSNGKYTSPLRGVPEQTYTIDIEIDGHHFTSSSTMQSAPVMNSFRFVWKKMLSERILFADLRIQDQANKANYYFMHIYRNGIGYRWAVMTDEKNPNDELQQLFTCVNEKDMDKDDDDALHDGDNIKVEVRAIDRRSYDYLYSMQMTDRAGTNPIANYEGDCICLGYFSAYSFITHSLVFRRNNVEEE